MTADQPTSKSHFPAPFLLAILRERYALEATEISTLAGEVDFNYRVETTSQGAFVLKISPPETEQANLDLQVAALEHLAHKSLPFRVPKLLRSQSAQPTELISWDGKHYRIRVQHWVSGRLLDGRSWYAPELLQNWGKSTAALNLALADFDHPAAHRTYAWDPSRVANTKAYATHFRSDAEKELANYFWELFETRVKPELSGLRCGVNYNDAHEQNLLIAAEKDAGQVVGIIDFGDLLYTQTINELAIAAAYAGMRSAEPITAMAELVRGFHTVRPLEEKEIKVLFPLIAARLLITVAQAANNRFLHPENPYLQVSESPAWDLLQKLRRIPPSLAGYTFRRACGWSAVPQNRDFMDWAKQHRASFKPVIELKDKKVIPLDCSVGSLDLGSNLNWSDGPRFCATIDRMMHAGDGEIGVGGYGEIRPFYTTDAFQSEGHLGPRWRTTHLGFDLWTEAGTPVFAPLAGTVHSFSYDPAPGSYGATILLTHETEKFTFHTLYGHLSMSSITGLSVGQDIAAGQQIATLGAYAENGGWPPHLHFQVMLDDLGYRGDFPGVAYPEEALIWLAICPDPRWLFPSTLQIALGPAEAAPDPAKANARSQNQLLLARKEQLGRSLSLSYAEPLHIVRGYKQYLYHSDGRRYLDTVNNVAHVGHEHPKVVSAGQRQMAVLNTNTRYLHEQLTDFADSLLALFPPALAVVHFVNSGSEANELALRMARISSGNDHVIALENGYHGNTGGTIDVSSYKFDGKGGQGAPPTTKILPRPDIYRGLHRDPETAAQRYANYATKAIEALQVQGLRPAAFLHESILSCGGQIELPEGYLPAVYRSVRAAGGLCIADEVQTGLGRVGSHWWAFEQHGVVPDIVTIGKPLGNGHPIGAVVCTNEVADKFANGMEYFNTFGGNPVSCAIGRAVIQTVKEENLRENAHNLGHYLKAGFSALQAKYPGIGEVRGAGLFLGVELVEDPLQRTPATARAAIIKNNMRRFGFLMSTDGPDENVLKIKPPMCFTTENADLLLTYFERCLLLT